MRKVILNIESAKSKKAACNQAAYFLIQLDIWKQRKENIMSNKSKAEDKILRLKKTLEEIDRQINSINDTESNWQAKLEFLKTEYQLTEAEILETKSALLRKQINNLNKSAGVTETDEVLE